jgi:hypothetical protein
MTQKRAAFSRGPAAHNALSSKGSLIGGSSYSGQYLSALQT